MSEDLATRVQELLDSTINPAVAGHGGFVQLVDVKDNRVYLQLGGKNWQRLHRLAYAIGVCGVLHFLWLAKKANPAPYYYVVVLGLLLAIRGWDCGRRRVTRFRAATVPRAGQTILATLPPRASSQGEGR